MHTHGSNGYHLWVLSEVEMGKSLAAPSLNPSRTNLKPSVRVPKCLRILSNLHVQGKRHAERILASNDKDLIHTEIHISYRHRIVCSAGVHPGACRFLTFTSEESCFQLNLAERCAIRQISSLLATPRTPQTLAISIVRSNNKTIPYAIVNTHCATYHGIAR